MMILEQARFSGGFINDEIRVPEPRLRRAYSLGQDEAVSEALKVGGIVDASLNVLGVIDLRPKQRLTLVEHAQYITYVNVAGDEPNGFADPRAMQAVAVRMIEKKPMGVDLRVAQMFRGAGMKMLQGNNSPGPDGAARIYPQEAPAEFEQRARDASGGVIAIEPPLPIELMKKRPLMLAQYLLDAWIVRDMWAQAKWTDHTNERMEAISHMREEMTRRVLWEAQALDVSLPPFQIGVLWRQEKGDLVFTFRIISQHLRDWLIFESRDKLAHTFKTGG